MNTEWKYEMIYLFFLWIALIEVGGFGQLEKKYMNAIPTSIPENMTHCALPKEHAFQILRPADDPDMPWVGFILGQTPASIW